jgi:hypothetical protein
MATQSVEFSAPPSQTLTVRLFAAGSDTIVATAGTVTAATNRKGLYTADFTNAPAGEYKLIATNPAGTPMAHWWTKLTLTTATFQTYEMPESRSPTAGETADAVWDEAYSGHTTAGTFGKLMDLLRKSNTVLEGTILASPTPTTTVFKVSGIDYPTGALEHAILWMASGTSQNQNSPILTTVNNGDGTVTVTLEEPLVTAPVAGDTVLIDPTSHVHTVSEIQGTMPDRLGYLLSILAGAISDAGTAAETYTITLGSSTFTVDYSGLDSTGNRTGATLTKT